MRTIIGFLNRPNKTGTIRSKHVQVACLAVLAFSIACLPACSTSGDSTADTASTPETALTESTESSNDSGGLTLSDVITTGGVYKLASDGSRVAALEQTNKVGWFTNSETSYLEDLASQYQGSYSPWDNAHYIWTSGNPVIIDRSSGDKLITISRKDKPSMYFYPVQWSGYTVASDIKGDVSTYYQIDGKETDGDTNALEPEGVYCDFFINDPKKDLASRRFALSDESFTFDASWHEGTTLHEGQFAITTPAYIAPYGGKEDYITIDLKIGSDGYAEADISGLDAGLYIASYHGDESADYIVSIA